MADFPLLVLNPILLENVITKMNDKSYCRLQQTCRDLAEFIRNNRNISVKSHRTLFYGNREDELSDIDKEGMYAVRFDCLHLPDEYSFETLCDFLREYRITSDTIAWGQSPKLDKEQLVTIFNILKPVTMLVRSFESNRFEALLQSKTIDDVKVSLDLDYLAITIPKLLFASNFSKIGIFAGSHETEQYSVLRTVLEILLSDPWFTADSFHFCIKWPVRCLPPIERLEELLGCELEWNTIFDLGRRRKRYQFLVVLPGYFPPGDSCKLTISKGGDRFTYIHYRRIWS